MKRRDKEVSKLIEYIETHCCDMECNIQSWMVAEFILEDRKRITKSLIPYKDDDSSYIKQAAIRKCLSLAGQLINLERTKE